MSEAKIQIKSGAAEFQASGDQDWVGQQLEKFLESAAKLAAVVPQPNASPDALTNGPSGGQGSIGGKALASFLKDRGATMNQVKKFLSTAIWLHAKGHKRLSTSDVSKALKDSNQTKLNNPSDCLNQNVKKGFCEKDGNQFFVTGDGQASA